mmetsp:Transcript_1761/g.5233  ORF Transcript_1761/g.5233 Transcript_1761/m.5233 type:complete len:351 (-) Transcript_1761:143-1195(-)
MTRRHRHHPRLERQQIGRQGKAAPGRDARRGVGEPGSHVRRPERRVGSGSGSGRGGSGRSVRHGSVARAASGGESCRQRSTSTRATVGGVSRAAGLSRHSLRWRRAQVLGAALVVELVHFAGRGRQSEAGCRGQPRLRAWSRWVSGCQLLLLLLLELALAQAQAALVLLLLLLLPYPCCEILLRGGALLVAVVRLVAVTCSQDGWALRAAAELLAHAAASMKQRSAVILDELESTFAAEALGAAAAKHACLADVAAVVACGSPLLLAGHGSAAEEAHKDGQVRWMHAVGVVRQKPMRVTASLVLDAVSRLARVSQPQRPLHGGTRGGDGGEVRPHFLLLYRDMHFAAHGS